ncbi:NAD-dependent protein deacetylase sirtuin-2-like [Bolinopsis microptera]|uniref:NAD-dependent protein deacetylase sirtuin-2-like n=1 Tax=Bolinopsis microptera TaxID=2820187 RepID=UPI003078F79E
MFRIVVNSKKPPQNVRTIFKLFGHEKQVDLLQSSAVTVREPEFPLSLTGRPRLTELSLKGVAKYMMTAECQNILVLSGHGISAPAGIPNYRKLGGIEARKLMGEKGWTEKEDAKQLFEKYHFSLLPYGMLRFVQGLWPGNHRPTYAHYFIRTLQEKGLLLRNWTENIDNLEKVCGIRSDKLIEFYGSFLTWRCENRACETAYDLLWLKERMEMFQFPNCSKCFHKTAPDIRWYHECSSSIFRQADVDAENCDLLIVIGSDLLTAPFCEIPKHVPWDVPRLIIHDTDITNDTDVMDLNVNFDFNSENAYRDVLWEGNTDLGILSLSSYLQWDRDVKYVMESDTALLPTRREIQERLGMVRDEDQRSKPLPKLR